ncbi:type VI secretion system membrane subunit TssM [Mesobaculum littorinae]|uniref:Type VI secretion system membrane subunit TssM n=1 Tax=Mesobaculum littorinae TaxID=2486419 RepID=A0A438AI14_9RHOB|nr:type VI secretion system membrane subunit TssM [Mesobaculum littorinae]RVV98298.1 type VI secretion system membrane subunit TssM [Mesobaculum littorinae]
MNPLAMWTSLRSTLDSYVGVLGRRFLSVIWVGAICALIWIFGPRLAMGGVAPLSSIRARLIAIGVVILGWILWMLIAWIRARRADRALAEDATETPEERAASESRAEIAELQSRLKAAMALMRKVARRRTGYAYEFPWYLMMGPPGAGKTTLLTNSGLKFPLGDAMGAEPVQGVGGTRNCNWWFTDRAILIDTAGRYTTQDSQRERDNKGFLGFLRMLRKHRRAQPINGIILTLSLTDLLTQDPDDRLREVRAVRQRLAEIEESLGARIPVYVVLTKADKLNGFAQFFEELGGQSREQVWGMTFDWDKTAPGTLPESFSREYRALQDRLSGLLLERLQQETDIARRGAIFRFPAQVAALHDSLLEIVEELASGNANVSEPMIRGVYFASATQEAEARRSGAGPARSMNRSYFVNRLFGEVILGEAALVSRDRRVSRRKRLATTAAYGAVTVAALLLTASWVASFLFNSRALADAENELAQYTEQARNIPVDSIADSDFLRVLPALNTIEQAPDAFEGGTDDAALYRVGMGLGQEDRIIARHGEVYADALGAYLLPRYMVALQDRLKTPDLGEAEAFETLKHYLALAGLGPIDPDALLAQAETVFADLYPGSGRADTRAALMRHMAAMLDRGDLPVMAIDDALVADIREEIGNRSPAQRTLDLLETRTSARALGLWTPAEALGPAGSGAFVRASGTPLDQGIPGLFTREGYREVVLASIGPLAEIAADEAWVRGPAAARVSNVSDVTRDAMQLYWTEFDGRWRDLVSDLKIRSPENLADASDLVALLASQADPIGRLSREIAIATNLAQPATALAGETAEGATEIAAPEPGAGDLPFDPLAAPDPFRRLRRTLDTGGAGTAGATDGAADGAGSDQAAQPDDIAALGPLFDEIYQQLGRVSATDARATEVFAADSQLNTAVQALVAKGRGLPAPADAWTVGFATSLAGTAMGRARDEVARLWAADGAPECTRAIAGRYPFAPEGTAEVTLDDFTRIFGPGGMFQTFFDQNLADFVDVSTDPWSWKGGLGTTGESSQALQQFQRAAAIRTAFFPSGETAPRVEITFDLRDLDPAARVALVEIGGGNSVHGLDRAEQRTLAWPGEAPSTSRITLLPGDRANALQTGGEWSPFRLFDAATTTRVSDNEFDAAFRIDGRRVSFRVTAGSVNNPFALPALADFACPATMLE